MRLPFEQLETVEDLRAMCEFLWERIESADHEACEACGGGCRVYPGSVKRKVVGFADWNPHVRAALDARNGRDALKDDDDKASNRGPRRIIVGKAGEAESEADYYLDLLSPMALAGLLARRGRRKD